MPEGLYSLLEFLVVLVVLFLRSRFPGWLDFMPLRLVLGAYFILVAELVRFQMFQEWGAIAEELSLWLLPFGLLLCFLWLVGGVLALVRRATRYRALTLLSWLGLIVLLVLL